MRLPLATALTMCDPLLNAVDEHPCEVAPFVEDLVVIEDQPRGALPFWGIWQAFADRVQTAGWIHHLDSQYAIGNERASQAFSSIALEGRSPPLATAGRIRQPRGYLVRESPPLCYGARCERPFPLHDRRTIAPKWFRCHS